MAMWMAAIVAPIQIFAGDMHGINTLRYQPAKIAAMEGNYKSYPNGGPLTLFGIPDDEAGAMRHAVEIPKLGSLILKHDGNAPLAGLDAFPRQNWPPVRIVFWTFRIMVAIGFAMLALGVWSLFARMRGKLYDSPWLHRAALVMGPSGFVAVLCGWATTESGRQPFTVYGLLRTADSLSPVGAPAVAASLLAFVVVYFAVFGVGTWFILRLMSAPPHPHETGIIPGGPHRAAGITPVAALGSGAEADADPRHPAPAE